MIHEYLKDGKKMFKNKIEIFSNYNTIAFSNNSQTGCNNTLLEVMKHNILIVEDNTQQKETKKEEKTPR